MITVLQVLLVKHESGSVSTKNGWRWMKRKLKEMFNKNWRPFHWCFIVYKKFTFPFLSSLFCPIDTHSDWLLRNAFHQNLSLHSFLSPCFPIIFHPRLSSHHSNHNEDYIVLALNLFCQVKLLFFTHSFNTFTLILYKGNLFSIESCKSNEQLKKEQQLDPNWETV